MKILVCLVKRLAVFDELNGMESNIVQLWRHQGSQGITNDIMGGCQLEEGCSSFGFDVGRYIEQIFYLLPDIEYLTIGPKN